MAIKKNTMSIAEVADFLGKTGVTIRNWIKSNKIEAVKNDRNRYVFDEEYIISFKNKLGKKNKLKKEVAYLNNVKKYRLNKEEKEIIKLWNDHVLSLEHTRHRKVIKSKIKTIKTNISRICRIENVEYILKQSNIYLDVCSNKDNIIKGKDYSYTGLDRLLDRMYSDLTNNKEHWWVISYIKNTPIKDVHPKLTQFVADMFAIRFLGEKTFKMFNPSKDYKDFYYIGERISYIIKYYKNSDIYDSTRPLFVIAGLVFDGIVNQFSNQTIYPASIARDKFWEMEFVQYIRREFGVTLRWTNWEEYTRRDLNEKQ